MSFEDFPSQNSPLVDSDLLIRRFVENDVEAKSRLNSHLSKLNLSKKEFFIITDYCLNDVLTAATKKGISQVEIIENLLPPYTAYCHLFVCGSGIFKKCADSLVEFRKYNLSLTDWANLWVMAMEGFKLLISDKTKIDNVLIEPRLANDFGHIKRA